MLHIGTSGWQYAHWRGVLYPPGLPQRQWLERYADTFATVEVNNTFYRLPQRDTFAGWSATLRPDFVVALKMSRYLTHIRRLRDPAEPVARFLDRTEPLGHRRGPVLLQLPPTLPADPEALDAVLRAFPRTVRVAVEVRERSWWAEEIRAVLDRHGAALCWADRGSRPVSPLWRTAEFGYLRLHGAGGSTTSYGTRAIDGWCSRIAGTFASADDVYVYFNNDQGGAAVHNAQTMLRRAAQVSV
jgi:uncharacterized protein YecE (DUF72 family)